MCRFRGQVNVKVFYLLFDSIALRTLSLSYFQCLTLNKLYQLEIHLKLNRKQRGNGLKSD